MKTRRLFSIPALIGCSIMAIASANAFAEWVSCTPAGVATYANRIHIRCAQSYGGVLFFAYGTSDASGAARYLSVATSALISGRGLRINYDPADTSGTSIGCQVDGCRLLSGLEIE